MSIFKDRRVITVVGTGAALALGLLLAAVLMAKHAAPGEAPPASQGGLVVQTGRDDDIKLDPQRPLRCFVGGRFVGELPLSVCAQKNGVATGALDVGLDPSGALAASNAGAAQLTPLPAPTPDIAAEVADTPAPAARGACWAYGDATWNRLPGEMSLNACVKALYAGQCTRNGVVAYGRWADRTLRLIQGRVEISPDNRNFRLLVDQSADCPATD